jgi:hypothetical protein
MARYRHSVRQLSLGVACVVLLTAVTGCVLNESLGAAEALEPCREPAANFDPAWPQDTLTDWVSYSDQLSIVTVTSEAALGEPTEMNGGFVGRNVVLDIERTLWRRDGAPSVDGTLTILTSGWIKDRPISLSGGTRLEVGGRYILPLTRAGGEWTVNTVGLAAFPLDGTTIVCGTVHPSEMVDEDIAGMSVDELAALYAATPADPLAVKHARLGPQARWMAVSREQE